MSIPQIPEYTKPVNFIYGLRGMTREGRTVRWFNQLKYVPSLVENGKPSGFNAIQLAREDGIAPTRCRVLGQTSDPIDARLVGVDPDKLYEEPTQSKN